MSEKEKILAGQFKELRRSVFNKTLEESREGTYTEPLCEEDECLLVEQVLAQKPESKEFLLDYMAHYPLSNKAIDMLIAEAQKPDIKQILLTEIRHYGFNEDHGFAILKKITDFSSLKQVCESGRSLYPDLYHKISSIEVEENLGEIYKKAVERYRSKKS